MTIKREHEQGTQRIRESRVVGKVWPPHPAPRVSRLPARASEPLGACEPHRVRVQPRPGPVQRRAAACERQFRHVRAAAWRVSAAPCPVRAGHCPVPAAPWRVRVHPWAVSIAPWACVSRGLGVCEMTLGACKSSLGACQESLGISHLRQNQPTTPPLPLLPLVQPRQRRHVPHRAMLNAASTCDFQSPSSTSRKRIGPGASPKRNSPTGTPPPLCRSNVSKSFRL